MSEKALFDAVRVIAGRKLRELFANIAASPITAVAGVVSKTLSGARYKAKSVDVSARSITGVFIPLVNLGCSAEVWSDE